MAKSMSSVGYKLNLPSQNTWDTSPPMKEHDAVAVDTLEVELI